MGDEKLSPYVYVPVRVTTVEIRQSTVLVKVQRSVPALSRMQASMEVQRLLDAGTDRFDDAPLASYRQTAQGPDDLPETIEEADLAHSPYDHLEVLDDDDLRGC